MIESPLHAESAQRSRLRDFLHDCIASTRTDQPARLAEAAEVFCLTAETRTILAAMSASGAYESAAMLVIGTETRFMLSRGGPGLCLATTVLSDGVEDATAEAATLALALLAAHAVALLANHDGASIATGVTGVPIGARLN